MTQPEDIDARLARLSAKSAGLKPSPGFSARVMHRVGQEQPMLYRLNTPARRFAPLGMLAAALAMVWAVSVSSQVDEAMAASDDTELSW
jgi:hypothetical protein